MKTMTTWTIDTESTTTAPTHVWAYGICEVGNINHFLHGDSLDELFNFWEYNGNDTYYFHNLQWDGEFLFCYLFEHGFNHVKDRRVLETKTFTTLISDDNRFYTIEICFYREGKKTRKVKILDSMKLLPFSVAEIAKSFKLPYSKGEIDYKAHDLEDKPITAQELDYLKRDVTIPAMALEVFFRKDLIN
jgi:hypothetical protein